MKVLINGMKIVKKNGESPKPEEVLGAGSDMEINKIP
jgi:hypothetical protein